jgi:H+/Cl- antiporter ClcA
LEKSKVYKLLSQLNNLKWSLTYKGVLVGLVSGVLVSLYRYGIELGTEKALQAYIFLDKQPIYIFPWLLAIVLISLIIHKLITLEPYSKGSGIPQVEGIVLLGMKMKWYTILLVRFTAGLAASFFGVSVGREGPSIQIGACGAQALSKVVGKNKVEKNYLITAGAAAGLSAAFNAPLSGIIFTLEEVHRSFSPYIFAAATTAALTADFVSNLFFGQYPVLDFLDVPQMPLRYYFLLLVAGVLSGMVGSLTNKCLLIVSLFYEKIPPFSRPMLALLTALPCGLLLPQVLGGGQNLIQIARGAKEGILMLLIFLVVKLVFTCICFGSGIPGGIFLPILAIGALTGGLLGQIAVWSGMPSVYIPVICVCAMAGALSSSVKAPITSILLMAEMTGSLVQMLPVALVAFIALFTSDLLNVKPIYEVLLDRIASQTKAETGNQNKNRALMEVPVELGSFAAGKEIKEINWPAGLLIVSLRRGNEEIVPNGSTKVYQGDYLVVLSSIRNYDEMSRLLRGLCHSN